VLKKTEQKVAFLLSITVTVANGAMAKDLTGLNQPDYLFFRNLLIDEEILPEVLYRLKKYKKQLQESGLWDNSVEKAERPELSAQKKRKPQAPESVEIAQVGTRVEISKMTGHIWDLINALKASGGRARKVGDEFVWSIESANLGRNREQLESLGIDFSKIEIAAGAPIDPGPALTITRAKDKLTLAFPYKVALIDFLRNQKDFVYNKEDHSRSVKLTPATAGAVKAFIDKASAQGLKIVGLENVADLQKQIAKGAKERAELEARRVELDAAKVDFDVEVPNSDRLKKPLFGYQKAGVVFLNKAGGRGIIGDEMGLGKTLQALAWVVTNGKKAIVICPKSFIYGWEDEIEKFSSATVQVLTNKKVPLAGADFTIVNYESAAKYDFKEFDALIIDESHMVKNKTTARFKEVKKLADRAKHVICLSGTAIVNRPVEFFTQINLVNSGITGTYTKYTNRYCGAFHDGYRWNVAGASNLDELVSLISPVYIRRNKKDVLKDLPDLIRQEIVVQGIRIEEPDDRSADGILAWITKTKVSLADAKTDATIEFAKNMIEQGGKVVIFSDYIEPVKKIAAAFGDEAIAYLADLTPEQRSAAQKQFQENPKKRVFVATSKIASVALTLTAASKVIFNDLPWTPGGLMQAEARAHRVGQKDTVNVYRMVARGTLDDQVTELLTKKAEILKTVLEGKSGELTAEEGQSADRSILTDVVRTFRVPRPASNAPKGKAE
jgi:SWI/SNF-related matrix-associated actin-dependent regulator 1 of chromatin subfamily A